jgi:DNA polymerase III subunit epsilon
MLGDDDMFPLQKQPFGCDTAPHYIDPVFPPDNNISFVAIDFETANEQKSSPCSIGIAVVKNGVISETKVWLIRPIDMRFASANIMIHGIQPHHVVNCPEFPHIWESVRSYIEDRVVVAHYAPFDISVLKSTLALYNLLLPSLTHHCSCAISRKVWPHLPNHKLNTVTSHLNIPLNHHEAESDAIACARIMLNACKESNVHSLTALAAKYKKNNPANSYASKNR